jgi:hypothetical protein
MCAGYREQEFVAMQTHSKFNKFPLQQGKGQGAERSTGFYSFTQISILDDEAAFLNFLSAPKQALPSVLIKF